MHKFKYVKVSSAQEAHALLTSEPNSRLISGGTDLLPLMKDGIVEPATLVDISGWTEGAGIFKSELSLRIGATTSLASIAFSPPVRERYTALAEACAMSASPQLRNMGTIGGNLMQQTRCWYYRGPFDCWLKGGQECYARTGQHEHQAIFHTAATESMCVSVHPSDPAAALLVLDASVEFLSQDGFSTMPVETFFALPTTEHRAMTILPADAVITAVILPARVAQRRSIYRKVMPRASWSFALAGIALRLEIAERAISDARLVLSGVAPIPIRFQLVESQLIGSAVDMLDYSALCKALTSTSMPLELNAYKLTIVEGLFKEALAELRQQVS